MISSFAYFALTTNDEYIELRKQYREKYGKYPVEILKKYNEQGGNAKTKEERNGVIELIKNEVRNSLW